MTQPWYMNYDGATLMELLSTQPRMVSLIPEDFLAKFPNEFFLKNPALITRLSKERIAGTGQWQGTGFDPATQAKYLPAAGSTNAAGRWERRGDYIIDNETGAGYSILTAPAEAKAALGLTTPTPTGSGAQAGFFGGAVDSEGNPVGSTGGTPGAGSPNVPPPTGGPPAAAPREGPPPGAPTVETVYPGIPGAPVSPPLDRGHWGDNPQSGLPAGMGAGQVWYRDEHGGQSAPPGSTFREPTWQELDAHLRGQGKPGIPKAVTNPITGVQRGTPFLGTNLPRLSAQAERRLLPSEREVWDTTIIQTGGRPEDFWHYNRQLNLGGRTGGYSMAGAPRAGRR